MFKKYLLALILLHYALPLTAGCMWGWGYGLLITTSFFGGWIMWIVLFLQFAVGNTSAGKLTKAEVFIRAIAWPTFVFPAGWLVFQLGETGILDFRVNATHYGFPVYSFAVHALYAISVLCSYFVVSVANED